MCLITVTLCVWTSQTYCFLLLEWSCKAWGLPVAYKNCRSTLQETRGPARDKNCLCTSGEIPCCERDPRGQSKKKQRGLPGDVKQPSAFWTIVISHLAHWLEFSKISEPLSKTNPSSQEHLFRNPNGLIKSQMCWSLSQKELEYSTELEVLGLYKERVLNGNENWFVKQRYKLRCSMIPLSRTAVPVYQLSEYNMGAISLSFYIHQGFKLLYS